MTTASLITSPSRSGEGDGNNPALVSLHLRVGDDVCVGNDQGVGMKLLKVLAVWALCLLLAVPMHASATRLIFDERGNIIGSYAEAPTSSTKMSAAVSGSIQTAAVSRGFSVADPRVASTVSGATKVVSGIAGTAAAVTVGAVSAPAWASIALAAGVGAIVSYAISLGLEALVKWLFRTDGKIDESDESLQVPTTTAMTVGGAYWRVSFHSGGVNVDLAGGDGEALARQGYYEYRAQTGQDTQSAPNCTTTQSQSVCGGVIYATKQPSGAPASCPAGTMYKAGACSSYTFASPSAVPSKVGLTPQQAINDIPASDLDKPLNPTIIAATANRLWEQAASQPGYDGLPYPSSNPITSQEAASWAAANPDYAPTVRDFVSPNPNPPAGSGAAGSQWSLPQNPSTTTNPAQSNPQMNLGPDPNIGAPTLEATPTAYQIAKPVLDLFPTLRSFQPVTHTGACPRPTIDLYGSHVLDAHCRLIEDNKAVIQGAMAFAWVALALFIILSA